MFDLIIPFLICFPFLIAVILLCCGKSKFGNIVSYLGAAVIMIASVAFFVYKGVSGGFAFGQGMYVNTEIADYVILAGEILIVLVVTFLSFKYKRYWVSLLSILPTAAIIFQEETAAHEEIEHIYIDKLALLMIILVGVVGSLIIMYAVGYMEGYHNHHKELYL